MGRLAMSMLKRVGSQVEGIEARKGLAVVEIGSRSLGVGARASVTEAFHSRNLLGLRTPRATV